MNNSKTTRFVKVAIIEDDPLRVAGFHAILDRYTDLQISEVSVLELANPNTADIVILQERRIGLSITIEHVKSVWPRVPIVVTASALSKEVIVDALRRGARGCIQENSGPDEFARAIRVIAEGQVWAPRSILAALIERYLRDDAHIRGAAHLTLREKQVLEQLVGGMSNREIAEPLGIEIRTVKAHISALMRKLGVRNRIALSSYALTHPELISSNVGGQGGTEIHA